MPTNFVLIDFENVQPKNLGILKDHHFKIFVFIGDNQNKVSLDLASKMQSFGEDAEYIKIDGNGKNALDFHIAYYLGELKSKDPKGYFHIISKDKGFDPLVKHLKANKIRVYRHNDLAEIPLLRISNAAHFDVKIEEVIKNLKGRGQSRPRKLKTLTNTINSLFTNKMSEKEMTNFINMLKAKKYISISDDKISYNFKNSP